MCIVQECKHYFNLFCIIGIIGQKYNFPFMYIPLFSLVLIHVGVHVKGVLKYSNGFRFVYSGASCNDDLSIFCVCPCCGIY